jgi:hypothetical protein
MMRRQPGDAPMAKKSVRKPAAKKSAKPQRKATPRKAAGAKAARRKAPAKGDSLGRPLVTAEEKLYMLFKEDYESRQIFEFLRVETVGELEQYSPEQIIRILSAPVRKTVERIRERLAENKRSLRDDGDFARDYLKAHQSR